MVRKLAFVIHALNTGGAERVLVEMANHYSQQGDAVTVITLDAVASDAFAVHCDVRRIGLGLLRSSTSVWQAIRNNLARIRALRRAIDASEASCVVSFTDKMNVLTLLSGFRVPWNVVLAERSDPRRQWMGRDWEWLRRRTYPRCHSLVVQTEAVAAYGRELVRGRPVQVIPNAVHLPDAGTLNPSRECQIIAVGRLSREKGFDLLLRAFAQTAASRPQWTLHILGDGPARSDLEHLADVLGIAKRVRWAGWVAQPLPLLQQASIFALPSRYEGFPNALLEAMACGLACVSFDCDSGPAEIIEHGVSGLLVPPEDVSALAAALARLMADEDQRLHLANGARQAAARFDYDTFFRRWDQVLDEACAGLQ